MSGEKLRIRYNAFESNIREELHDIRNDGDFFDVTLVCEDGQIQAHKLVISACSPFFKKIFQCNPQPHPLLYLKDITIGHLQSVLDFMYHGEIFIFQENIDSFLAVAQELKVKGLTMSQDTSFPSRRPTPPKLVWPSNEKVNRDIMDQSCVKKKPMHLIQQIPEHSSETEMNDNDEIAMEKYYGNDEAQTEDQDVKTMRDLDQYIQSETGKNKGQAKCKFCDKTFSRKENVREHLAYKHFNHIFNKYTCQICGKNLGSKLAYVNHAKKKHPWTRCYQAKESQYTEKNRIIIWKRCHNWFTDIVNPCTLIPFSDLSTMSLKIENWAGVLISKSAY